MLPRLPWLAHTVLKVYVPRGRLHKEAIRRSRHKEVIYRAHNEAIIIVDEADATHEEAKRHCGVLVVPGSPNWVI